MMGEGRPNQFTGDLSTKQGVGPLVIISISRSFGAFWFEHLGIWVLGIWGASFQNYFKKLKNFEFYLTKMKRSSRRLQRMFDALVHLLSST